MVKPRNRKLKTAPKRVLRLPDLDLAKRTVLNSLGSPDSTRVYAHAIDDFIAWYCSEPRLAFGKHVVLRYRIELESRRLAPATINVRLAAVRRLVSSLRGGRQRIAQSGTGRGHPARERGQETRSSAGQLADRG